MPVFCIITGYQSRYGYESKQLIKLFGLFMIMNFSFYVYEYVAIGMIDGSIIKYTSWYIIDLIIWRLLYKQLKNKKVALIMCFIGIFFMTVIPNNFDVLNLDMLIFYFSFFLLGSFDIFEDRRNKKLAYMKLGAYFVVIILCMIIFRYDYSFFTTLYNSNTWLVIARIILYGCAYGIARNSYIVISDKEIKIFTNVGRCSLGIYFFQTILTMIFSDLLHSNKFIVLFGLFYALIICIALGNIYVSKALKYIMNSFLQWHNWLIMMGVIVIAIIVYGVMNKDIVMKEEVTIYNVLSKENVEDIKNRSVSIGTIGDLILLEEQIKDSYNDNKYNFNYMFKYMSDDLKETDYMIANLTGISDDDLSYSKGNKFESNRRINVPSTLFNNLYDNNFKLINVGNQMMLSDGEESLFKTLDNIERSKMDYVGAYKDRDEEPKIIEIKGIKVGILSYSYMTPSMSESELYYDYEYVNKFLCSKDSRRFDRTIEQIKKEFKYLKDKGTDLILVMPSNSFNSSHELDATQKMWNDLFIEWGADVIIGNYSNSTQMIQYEKDTLIINSSGSFVNIKNGEDSDLSVMTRIYIDKERKNVNGVSIIPLYSYKNGNDGYYALPIYRAMTDKTVISTLSQTDIDRMMEGIKVITKTMLGKEIDVLENEYFYFVDGYKRQEVKGLEISKIEERSTVYKLISKSKTTCYVGDYYTTGSHNGGFGWHEPVVSTFGNKKVVIADDDMTSEKAKNEYTEQMHNSNCDLFVVALGSVDIRKNASNVDDYIENMDILLKNLNKDIIVIAPWIPLEIEYNDETKYTQDMELFDVYNKRLKTFCEKNNYVYVNPNNYINDVLTKDYIGLYYNDEYFLNNKGIELFSRSIFN